MQCLILDSLNCIITALEKMFDGFGSSNTYRISVYIACSMSVKLALLQVNLEGTMSAFDIKTVRVVTFSP